MQSSQIRCPRSSDQSLPVLSLMTAAVSLSLMCTICSIQGTLAASNDGERSFYQVDRSQIRCADGSRSSQLADACRGDADCLISEAGDEREDADNKLRSQEWARVSRAMQDLATDDRLADQYPDGMQVLLPSLPGLRRRLCPVRYDAHVYPETVPMLIVHARCTQSSVPSPAPESDGYLHCREVLQYRKVYKKLPECRTADTARARVYAKHFVHVSVNCAAFYDKHE